MVIPKRRQTLTHVHRSESDPQSSYLPRAELETSASKWLDESGEGRRREGLKVQHSWREKLSKLRGDLSFRRKSCSQSSSSPGLCTDRHYTDVVPKRRVTFGLEKNAVYEITTVTNPSSELWWTSEELYMSRLKGRETLSTVPSAQQYIHAFAQVYREVTVDRKLTSNGLRDLVLGISYGYRGIEQHTCPSVVQRKKKIREHALSVVNFYYENGNNSQFNNFDESCDSLFSATSLSSSTKNQEKALRNHSARSSSGSRHLAAAMAKADFMAAAGGPSADGNIDGISELRCHRRRRESV